jgi:hypothetical protein
MDWNELRTQLALYDVRLLTLGSAEITVSSLLKLGISAWLLYLIASKVSRFLLGKLLAHTGMSEGQR